MMKSTTYENAVNEEVHEFYSMVETVKEPARGEARGIAIGEARVEVREIAIGEARGETRGITIGENKGENRLAELINFLSKEKKYKEIEAVSTSREKRHELYRQYGI